MRVGIFGGAFNPPHIGHLVCANEARWQLELDRVVLMPVGQAPHRKIEPEPGREVRYELCRAAVAEHDELEVSRFEIDRSGPSYTVETLEALRDEDPERDLVFIVGSDQAAQLESWHRPERVLELAELGVVGRDGGSRDRVEAALSAIGGSGRVHFFEMPKIGISSTVVRERIAEDLPWRHLVPRPVADEIDRAGLYRPAVGAGAGD